MIKCSMVALGNEGSKFKLWYVYELVDPRNNTVFYIGKTDAPANRFRQHRLNPKGSAYARIQEIITAGGEASMKIIGKFNSSKACLEYERQKIGATPGLVNKALISELVTEAPRAPSERCLISSAPIFDGVLQIGDALAIWHQSTKADRVILEELFATGGTIKRALGYPIRWSFRARDGKTTHCKTSTIARLNRRGLIRSKEGREYKLTPLGKFAVKHSTAGRSRTSEVVRAA